MWQRCHRYHVDPAVLIGKKDDNALSQLPFQLVSQIDEWHICVIILIVYVAEMLYYII